jgi:hypothetical protein
MSLILNGTVGVTFPDTTTQSTAAGAVDVQTFDESGTWTKPISGSMVRIQVWGGGGGGARNTTTAVTTGSGGGGYNEIVIPLSTLASTETVTVGAGGTGRTASAGNGTAGGASSFGTLCTAYGGAGAITGNGWVGGGSPLGAGSFSSSQAPSLNSIFGGPNLVPDTYQLSSNTARYFTPPSPFHGGMSGMITAACTADFAPIIGSIYGGGAGACAAGSVSFTGAQSIYGGNGGNGGRSTSGIDGAIPAGGGGSRNNSLNGGNGGSGRVIVTVW